jgi:starch synthase (maltosyl-transferring)
LYDNLRFHRADHGQMLCYSKCTPDFQDRLLFVVSFDAVHEAAGNVHLDLGLLGLDAAWPYQVKDLLHGQSYTWQGSTNFVMLRPHGVSMHAFQLIQ